MKIKHAHVFILALMIVILTKNHTFAAAWEVDIDADYSYNDKIREVIIAKGNVKARANDFYLESPYVKYYYNEKKIVAEDRFFIDIEGYRISGSRLEYNYRENTGVASIVRINFGDTYLGANYMTINNEKMELFNAYFTGCNKSGSDYHVSANELALYPRTGLIIAYWATAWIASAPVIPVPTFVYSTPVPRSKFIVRPKKIRKLTEEEENIMRIEEKKHTQPIPEIGSNDEDGWFIRQGFNWFLGPKQYAKFLLSHKEKNYTSLGVRTNYRLSDYDEGEIRLAQSGGEGFYGGITHYLSFGPEIISEEDEEWMIYDTYAPGGKYAYEVEVNLSHRERLNLDENVGPYNRISFSPKVTLRSNRQPLPIMGDYCTYYMEVNTAQVSEEPISTSVSTFPTQSERKEFYADITLNKLDLGVFGNFSVSLDNDTLDYPTAKRYWQKASQKMGLSQSYFKSVYIDLTHVHYIYQDGNGSPFEYETYEYSPFDQFLTKISFKLWWSSISMGTRYNLPSWDLYSVNYGLDLGMHCYDLLFNYRIVFIPEKRTEFGFTLDLSNSRWTEK